MHYVDSGLDTGQVIGFSKFRVETNNLNLLEEKVHEIEHKLLPLICSLIKNNYIEFKENVLKIEGHVYPNGKEFIFSFLIFFSINSYCLVLTEYENFYETDGACH